MTNECPGHCQDGWVRWQHPTKPIGIVMSVTPCQVCNIDGKKPAPVAKAFHFTMTEVKDFNPMEVDLEKALEKLSIQDRCRAYGFELFEVLEQVALPRMIELMVDFSESDDVEAVQKVEALLRKVKGEDK